MNLELLEQFGQNYPEEFDGALDCVSIAVTCQFNRRGTLLAVGCNDGRIVIWDFLTRGIAKVIQAHVHPICSLSWSRNGKKIASAATDTTACIWDVLTGDNIHRWRLPNTISKVQFHPRNDRVLLVCLNKHAATIIYLDGPSTEASGPSMVTRSSGADKNASAQLPQMDQMIETRRSGSAPKNHVLVPLDDDSDLNIVASFDGRGQFVYSGNAKGRVVVSKVGSLPGDPPPSIVASFRVSNTAVKQIEFAPRRKDCFLVNTADRIIRLYDAAEVLTCGVNGEPEPVQKLQDLVNKTMWKKCCFSGGPDSEYVCAGSTRQHALYIYDRQVGNLVKILHGTKGEMLLDVVWHPLRAIIASISSGVVSIWSQAQVENWSAFAPDFKELDENVEYEERESEFDESDEDKFRDKNGNGNTSQEKGNEEEDVDVVGTEPISMLLSSDEEEEDQDELIYLQITPEIDDPEEGGLPIPMAAPLTGGPAQSEGTSGGPGRRSKAKSTDYDSRDPNYRDEFYSGKSPRNPSGGVGHGGGVTSGKGRPGKGTRQSGKRSYAGGDDQDYGPPAGGKRKPKEY